MISKIASKLTMRKLMIFKSYFKNDKLFFSKLFQYLSINNIKITKFWKNNVTLFC
jgi:hypothetical protein